MRAVSNLLTISMTSFVACAGVTANPSFSAGATGAGDTLMMKFLPLTSCRARHRSARSGWGVGRCSPLTKAGGDTPVEVATLAMLARYISARCRIWIRCRVTAMSQFLRHRRDT